MPTAPRPDLRVLQLWSLIIAAVVVVAPLAGLMLAPVLVALNVARGQMSLAAMTALAMAGAAGIGFWAPQGVLLGLAAASFGLPVGYWAAIGVPMARILARTAALASGTVVGLMAARAGEVQASMELTITEFERLVEEAGPAMDAETAERFLEVQRNIVEQWPYLLPGAAIAAATVSVSLALVLLQRLLLRSGGPPIPGRFRELRPPDWLAWLAIAAAVLWFADHEMPNEVLRLIAWNGAIALSGIYWLNGLAVLVAGSARLRVPQLLLPLVMLLMLLPQMSLVIAMVGFFDTWIEFRRRLEGIPPATTPHDNE